MSFGLWVQSPLYVLPSSLQCAIWCRGIPNGAVTGSQCTSHIINWILYRVVTNKVVILYNVNTAVWLDPTSIYIYDKAVKCRHITYNNATFNVSGNEIALKCVHYKLHI